MQRLYLIDRKSNLSSPYAPLSRATHHCPASDRMYTVRGWISTRRASVPADLRDRHLGVHGYRQVKEALEKPVVLRR